MTESAQISPNIVINGQNRFPKISLVISSLTLVISSSVLILSRLTMLWIQGNGGIYCTAVISGITYISINMIASPLARWEGSYSHFQKGLSVE